MKTAALILLDGESPSRNTLIAYWDRSDLRVCADGAATICLDYGLEPDLIIGDLDSLAPNLQSRFSSAKILEVTDQSTTDGEKAIQYCVDQGYRRINLLGALGKRVDHSLYNLGLLRKYHDRLDELKMVSDSEEAYLISQKTELSAAPGTRISLLPVFGRVDGVITRGLEYPVEDESLELGLHSSVSNTFSDESATVSFSSGLLLVVIGRQA